MTDEPNPYRSKLLEESEKEPSFWSVVEKAKWKYMTRRERAALVHGYALGLIPGLLVFWAFWWGIQYLWAVIF